MLYKRLASCERPEEIDEMVAELVDRFGLPPLPARILIDSHRLRIQGKALGILKIDAAENGIGIQFVPKPPIDPGRIISLVQRDRNIKLSGPDRLKIEGHFQEVESRIIALKKFFKSLNQETA